MPYNKAILHTLLHYRKVIWGVLQSFGPWGIFLAAAIDGAGIPLPGAVDAILVAYAYQTPWSAWLLVPLATVGSLLGCTVLYLIGYWGGEVLIERRMNPQKFHKISRDFDEHAFLTVAVPAILPPPFPFKVIVLAAGAFEMKWLQFAFAIVVGRLFRYGLLVLLTIKFGPQVVPLFATLVRRHVGLTLVVVLAIIAAALLVLRWKRVRRNREASAVAEPASPEPAIAGERVAAFPKPQVDNSESGS